MILTKTVIQEEIKSKRIKIEPFDEKSIGPASIDLTLADSIRIFDNTESVIDISSNLDYKKNTKVIKLGSGYILKPKELVLGITKEKVSLPDNICGWLQSRSRFARIGLMSHITAPFICPGVSNNQVLEIFNAGNHNIMLKPNVKICHLILQECKGKAKYKGKFKNQNL
jgi:dCTP deaminase